MSRPLSVALIQLPAFELAQHEAAWQELLLRIDEAAGGEPQLIVLPEASYPAYFLHSRETYERAGVRADAEVADTLAERARRHGCYVAAGVVQRAAGDDGSPPRAPLENVALLFGPDGALLARYAKRFLWHFDGRWFAPGAALATFELAGTRGGLLICADGRLPEIARSYAVEGARLLVQPTAWVSTGRDAATLTNPQVEYIMPARAIENGAWVVAADKVGVEAGSIVYAGRSGVIDPGGRWVAQAPSDRPGILTCTLDLDEAAGPPVQRRPLLYGAAAVPGRASVARARERQALVAADSASRVAVVALDLHPSSVELMERVRSLVRALAVQDAALVVLPDLAGRDARAVTDREFLPLFAALSAEVDALLVVQLAERANGQTYKTVYMLQRGSMLASHRQTHLVLAEQEAGFTAGDRPPAVIQTPAGYLGVLGASEGLAPELARGLKLSGAELVAWCAGDLGGALTVLARTRANENRAYVLAAGAAATDGACIADPAGGLAGATLSGEQMAASADVNRAFARWNEMAPRTSPLLDRDPATFASLFR